MKLLGAMKLSIKDPDYNSEEDPDVSINSNRWDPVTWFSQRGYNVTQMIDAPGK